MTLYLDIATAFTFIPQYCKQTGWFAPPKTIVVILSQSNEGMK